MAIGFDQAAYWRERHRQLQGDPRSVGNAGKSLEQNQVGEAMLLRVIDRAAEMLRPGRTVLDLGCGYGRISRSFTERGYRYLGVDVSPHAVQQAQDRNPEAEYVVADLASWNTERPFDVVCVLYVFVHFVEQAAWRAFLVRAMSMVAPGGVLLIADHFSETRETKGEHVVVRPFAEYGAVLEANAFVLDPLFVQRLCESTGIQEFTNYLRLARRPAHEKSDRARRTGARSGRRNGGMRAGRLASARGSSPSPSP